MKCCIAILALIMVVAVQGLLNDNKAEKNTSNLDQPVANLSARDGVGPQVHYRGPGKNTAIENFFAKRNKDNQTSKST